MKGRSAGNKRRSNHCLLRILACTCAVCFTAILIVPFLLLLAHPQVANYLHKELAYRYISDSITEGCKDDLEMASTINAYVFLAEEQNAPFIDVVGNSVYFDLVRHVGWCDQKANAMMNLLKKQNIKSRILFYDCHSLAEVWLEGQPRLFDPTFNCYIIQKSDMSIATIDALGNPESLVTSSGERFEEYGGKCIAASQAHRVGSILMDTEPIYKKIACQFLDAYYTCGGEIFCDAFLGFHFLVMENLRRSKLVDYLGPIRWHARCASEYNSTEYLTLYKARSYHLFGKFRQAEELYESLLNSQNFHDEAIFFRAEILLQTKRFGELRNICQHLPKSATRLLLRLNII